MNPLLQEIYSTIIPSAPYLVAAFVLVWAVLLVWVLVQFNRQRRLSQQLELLEEELAERHRGA